MPEADRRDLRALLLPKIMAAKDRFDVHFERDYKPPEVADWLETENVLPGPLEPYFLRADTGPRWMLGGVMSRPFITAAQCSGKFAISSIESSNAYGAGPLAARYLSFPTVDHCFCVTDGELRVQLKDDGSEPSVVRAGQTLVVSAGQSFRLEFASRYVRAITFTNGNGIEHLIHTAGSACSHYVLPDTITSCDESELDKACVALGVHSHRR